MNTDKARQALEKALPLIERERDLIVTCESLDDDLSTMTESAQADVAEFDSVIALIKDALGNPSATSVSSVVKGLPA